jgi:hypothetical protein
MDTEIWLFIRSLRSRWFIYVSGAPSVPLAAATLFVENQIARIGLWTTAILCFWLAAFFVWRQEHRKLRETREKVASLFAAEPDTDSEQEDDGVPKEHESGIWMFRAPPDMTEEERKLLPEIIALDHTALRRLRYQTRHWTEVHGLMYNVINRFLQHDFIGAQMLFHRAETAYVLYNQVRNRMVYLSGSIVGIGAALLLGLLILLTSISTGVPSDLLIAPKLLIIIVLFSGIGSTTSVLTRLSSIDLREEISKFLVFVSGFSKPFVATAFAVVVYLILKNKIVGITVGSGSDGDNDGVYAVTSFLCGFSERFASDIISRVTASPSQTPGHDVS